MQKRIMKKVNKLLTLSCNREWYRTIFLFDCFYILPSPWLTRISRMLVHQACSLVIEDQLILRFFVIFKICWFLCPFLDSRLVLCCFRHTRRGAQWSEISWYFDPSRLTILFQDLLIPWTILWWLFGLESWAAAGTASQQLSDLRSADYEDLPCASRSVDSLDHSLMVVWSWAVSGTPGRSAVIWDQLMLRSLMVVKICWYLGPFSDGRLVLGRFRHPRPAARSSKISWL